MTSGKNLFRATITEVPKIDYVIVEYQDGNYQGEKALIILKKLAGRSKKPRLVKIEKFENGKWRQISPTFIKHIPI